MRTILIPGILAVLLPLLTTSEVLAYGATYKGHTSVSNNGTVHHSSSGSASGPYGSAHYSGSTTVKQGDVQHTGSTTATGAYGGSYQSSTSRSYSPGTYNSYSAAGV